MFTVVTGARHAYWAWTGRTNRLTTVVEGVFAERPATRRWLWAIGRPLVALGGLAFAAVLTWLLV
ncbi:MAG: hypothetical protein ABEJ92_10185 [Halobacteriales archaeon]